MENSGKVRSSSNQSLLGSNLSCAHAAHAVCSCGSRATPPEPRGIEPRPRASESGVRPLNHVAILCRCWPMPPEPRGVEPRHPGCETGLRPTNHSPFFCSISQHRRRFELLPWTYIVHAENRTWVASMGGLHDAATLHVRLQSHHIRKRNM